MLFSLFHPGGHHLYPNPVLSLLWNKGIVAAFIHTLGNVEETFNPLGVSLGASSSQGVVT
jgi:hypothetical protein